MIDNKEPCDVNICGTKSVKLTILALLKHKKTIIPWIHRLIHEIIHFIQYLWKGIELGRVVSDAS